MLLRRRQQEAKEGERQRWRDVAALRIGKSEIIKSKGQYPVIITFSARSAQTPSPTTITATAKTTTTIAMRTQ